MASTYEGLRAEAAKIAPWLFPVISSASALGDTAYLIDTYLWESIGGYTEVESLARGLWVFRPDAATVTDRERKIGAIVIATGRITHDGVAWAVAPANAEQYEVHSIQPRISYNLLVKTMEELLIPTYAPVPGFTDADMGASGTSSYSLSGAGALSKVSAAANTPRYQSLFFNAGTADEYVETASVKVESGQQYFASAGVRVDAGGPFILVVWDKTNDVEIESGNRVDHSSERFHSLQRRFATPATCEEVSLRLYCTGATDDAYIDYFSGPHKATDHRLPGPTGLVQNSSFRKLSVARYQLAHPSENGVYDSDSRYYDDFNAKDSYLRVDYHHANPYTIETPRNVSLPLEELWAEILIPASDITAFAFTAAGETSPTTNAPKLLVASLWVKNVCEYILSYEPQDTEVQSTRLRLIDTKNPTGIPALMADYSRDVETPTQIPAHPLHGRSFTSI